MVAGRRRGRATVWGTDSTDADLPEVLGRPVAHTAGHLHRAAGPAVPEAQIARDLDGRVRRPGWPPTCARVRARCACWRSCRDAEVPAALVTASPRRIVDLVLRTLGAHWFAVTVAAEDTARYQARPGPVPHRGGPAGRPAPGLRRGGGQPDRVWPPPGRPAAAVVAVPSTVPIAPEPGVLLVGSLEEVDLALLSLLAAVRV